MDSYEHSYETQSSVLLLGPQKPCHFTKGLVLLLMHDRQAYKQEISTALNDKTSRGMI
jgi:hypothetical protein